MHPKQGNIQGYPPVFTFEHFVLVRLESTSKIFERQENYFGVLEPDQDLPKREVLCENAEG